jgi:4-aminobutyrate aminotransferase-like enzyme
MPCSLRPTRRSKQSPTTYFRNVFLAPDAARAAALVNPMRHRPVLNSASGTYDNVLKIRPPLLLPNSAAPRLVEALQETLHVTPATTGQVRS